MLFHASFCAERTTLCIDRYMDVCRKFHVAKGERERESELHGGWSQQSHSRLPSYTGVVYVVTREIAVSHCVSGMEGEESKQISLANMWGMLTKP
jgi:hypothetical protein